MLAWRHFRKFSLRKNTINQWLIMKHRVRFLSVSNLPPNPPSKSLPESPAETDDAKSTSPPPSTVDNLRDMSVNTMNELVKNFSKSKEFYAALESPILQHFQVHDEGKRRQLRYAVGISVFCVLLLLFLLRKRISSYFSRTTASVAKETLQDREVQHKTQELTLQVVHYILEDAEFRSQVSQLIELAAQQPRVQAALVNAFINVLHHQETVLELSRLSKSLLTNLSQDEESIRLISDILSKAIRENDVQTSLIHVLGVLAQNQQVLDSMSDLAVRLSQQPSVMDAVGKLVYAASSSTMSNEEFVTQVKKLGEFLARNTEIQQAGGDAVWGAVKYSVGSAVKDFLPSQSSTDK